MEFEWDENKNKSNLEKHGIDFRQAKNNLKMKNKIYWKEFVEKLSKGLDLKDFEIDFKNEKIDFKTVALLNRNGIKVPKELVQYADKDIDFSNDPELTDKEIENINMSFKLVETLPVKPEIKEWLKNERIDVNSLAAQLIRNFYYTVKNIQKNTAI